MAKTDIMNMDFHKTSGHCQYNMKADNRPTDNNNLQKKFYQ